MGETTGMTTSITEQILAALATRSEGLTSREVCALTRMASYTVSGKLSKLAAYGTVGAIKLRGIPTRYQFKPPAPAS
jgi:DNA-binding transcriptional regulator GbsR (MarR family)